MAFPLAPANGAINTQLTDLAADTAGGNWTPHPDYSGTIRIGDATHCFSNTLSALEALYVSSAPSSGDFDAQIQIGRWGTGSVDNFIGFCYHVQLGGKNFYRVRNDATNWLLEKVVAGAVTVLGSVALPALTAGAGVGTFTTTPTVIDIHVESGQHFVWITNAAGSSSRTTISANDSTFAAGYFGIWGSCGGATTGSAPSHTPTNGEAIIYSAAALIGGQNSIPIAAPTFVFAATSDVATLATPASGGALAGGAAPVSFVAAIPVSGGALGGGTSPASSVVTEIYDIGILDIEPRGGALVGGSAIVSDRIPYTPVGGALAGGSAVVKESINFVPAGGATCGGTAPYQAVYAPPASGGALTSGAAPGAAVYAIAPAGGALVSGAATITDRQAWYMPAGGALVGGTAVAYFVPAGFVVTTENPFADAFPGWAINFDTQAPSRYEGLPANSMTEIGGVTFVANAGGIYSMDADNDAGQPIHAEMMIPNTDYGIANNKRIPNIWLGMRTAVAMVIKVKTDNADARYYMVDPPDGNMRATRVEVGKGIEGRYIEVGIANMAGNDFEFDSMEIPLSILKRHGR